MMKGLICPRCDSNKVEKVADSPVRGKWEAYSCRECNYVWRSTEDLTNIDRRMEYWRRTAGRDWAD